jgi:hypothetical protein
MHFDRLRRREFTALLGGAAVGWPISVRGQEPRKRPLIGRLSTGSKDVPPVSRYIERFLAGMRELGYVEGRGFDMTYAMADFHADRLPQVTAELVKLAPDIILAGELSKPLPPEKPLPRFRLLSVRLPIRLLSASPRATPGLPAISRRPLNEPPAAFRLYSRKWLLEVFEASGRHCGQGSD